MSDSLDRGLNVDSGLIATLAHPKQFNYLDIQQGAAQAAESIWRTREWQAKQAAGEAAQQSFNADGTPNQPALLQNLKAAGPGAALAAQNSAQMGQTLSQEQQIQHIQRIQRTTASMAQLLNQTNGSPSFDAIKQLWDQHVREGNATPGEETAAMAAFGPDSAKNGQVIRQRMAMGLSTVDQFHRANGAPYTLDTGSGVDAGTVNPDTGALRPASTTGKTMGPDAAGGQVKWTDDKGVEQQGTGAQWAAAHGVPWVVGMPMPGTTLVAPAAGGRGAAAPPVPSTIQGGGVHQPRPIAGQPAPAAATPATPAAAPAPQFTATPGPSPGAVAGQEADVKAYQAGQSSVQVHQRNVQNLDTALQALVLTQSGVSTEAVHNFYSFLKAQGITPPFGDGNVTQYDIARKAMVAFAGQAAGAGGTDLSRMMSTDANANMHIDTDAALHVLKQNAGWENQQIGMQKEAPAGGKDYHKHIGDFPTNTVPEAFAWDRMTDPERQAIRDRQAKIDGGTAMLNKSLEYAAKHKLIGLPTQKPAAAVVPASVPHSALTPPPAQQNLLALA